MAWPAAGRRLSSDRKDAPVPDMVQILSQRPLGKSPNENLSLGLGVGQTNPPPTAARPRSQNSPNEPTPAAIVGSEQSQRHRTPLSNPLNEPTQDVRGAAIPIRPNEPSARNAAILDAAERTHTPGRPPGRDRRIRQTNPIPATASRPSNASRVNRNPTVTVRNNSLAPASTYLALFPLACGLHSHEGNSASGRSLTDLRNRKAIP